MEMQELHEEKIDLLEYWNVLWRRKYFLIALFIISVTIAMVFSFKLPKTYRSESVIMITSSESGGLAASPLTNVFGGMGGVQTPADKIMIILKSRTIAETVINKLDLLKVFYHEEWDPAKETWKNPDQHPLMEDAVLFVTSVVKISKGREGAITLSVEVTDSQLAADIANCYVNALTGALNEKAINVTIQVVDKAIPSEKKSGPKIRQNMMLVGVSSLFIGILIAFILEYVSKQKKAAPL